MKVYWKHALTACIPLLLAGCATMNSSDSGESWHKDWGLCAGAGGLVGAAGGAIEGSSAAGWGALGGALIGGLFCGLTQEPAVAQEAPPKPVPPEPKMVEKIVINDVGGLAFDFDSATLRPRTETILDKLAPRLIKEDAHLTITGFTDTSGPETYNLGLSKRRAESVMTYLESKGVKAANMKAEGQGEAHPVASNNTREGRMQNRRVKIRIESVKAVPVQPAVAPGAPKPGPHPAAPMDS